MTNQETTNNENFKCFKWLTQDCWCIRNANYSDEQTVKHNVIVVNNLNSNAIMGIDLIEKLGLVYKARKKTFVFEEEEPQFKQAISDLSWIHSGIHSNANPHGNLYWWRQLSIYQPQLYGYNHEQQISATQWWTRLGSTKPRRPSDNGGTKLQPSWLTHTERNKNGRIGKHPPREDTANGW